MDLLKTETALQFALSQETELLKIFELLDYKAKLVGGCVRDFILFNKLCYDIDIATEILPQEAMKKLGLYFNVIPTGLKHGTITIVGKYNYEITTLRSDDITDGRHALVSFNSSYEADSKRRDFTINALYSDITGKIYDYNNGIKDLQDKKIKFINDPSERIKEDYLRILRFCRFAVRFGNFDQESLKACLKLSNHLNLISKERVTSEVLKILEGSFFINIFEDIKEIFKNIKLKSEFSEKNFTKLSLLGKLFLFIQPESFLVLSNKQKNYIKSLRQEKLLNKTDAVMIFIKFGKIFLNDKMILEDLFFDIPEYIPSFPLNGNHLLEKSVNPNYIGFLLNKLQIAWIESDFKMNESELLNLI